MEDTKKTTLANMESGKTGTIVEIQGGMGMRSRLDSLGIREGIRIKKMSDQLFRGPVTLAIGNTQVAIGFGMAQRIIVEVE